MIRKGRLSFDFWMTATRVETQHDATEDVAGQGATEVVHDQALFLGDSRISAEYGFTDGFAVGLMLPFRFVETGIRYLDAGGDEVTLTSPEVHHRDEIVGGISDPWLVAHVGRRFGGWVLGGRAGITVPLGRTEDDPFALGDMGLEHQHIQLGTGTVNPILGVEAERSTARWRVAVWALTQQVLYENGKGYQAGDRYAGGLLGAMRFGAWTPRVELEVMGETAERWQGMIHEDEGNQGRVDLLAGVGVELALGPDLALSAAARAPLYTHVEGGQLDYPLIVTVGVTGSFGLLAPAPEPAHDHGHDHGHDHDLHSDTDSEHEHDSEHHPDPDPDSPPYDQSKDPTAGQAIDLSTEPGKYTVWDFWAPWCEPCLVLDRDLAALAKERPEVVIRRLNIVDWDSAATRRHLSPGGFNSLPHVKVYGPDGSLLLEESGSPPLLRNKIEELLPPRE